VAGSAGFDFEGASAIVTGGTRGIGRVIASSLVERGARVAVCGRHAPGDLPPEIAFYPVDVRDPDAVSGFVDAVAERHGGLDILVNNAGGSPEVAASAASARFSEAIVDLNLLAPLFLSQAAYRHMATSGSGRGGSIVNIASLSGTRPSPGTAAYGAAKAGLINLTRSLAQEWGSDGIRVNAIVAGLLATETTEATYGDAAAQTRVAKSVPLGRMGSGTDIASAVLWLASDAAAWVSGAALNVDGGGERPPFLDLVKGR
jgi:NAD(P)-dependent dehydrogenase (short-subunit alcohol dehydrogenase family)